MAKKKKTTQKKATKKKAGTRKKVQKKKVQKKKIPKKKKAVKSAAKKAKTRTRKATPKKKTKAKKKAAPPAKKSKAKTKKPVKKKTPRKKASSARPKARKAAAPKPKKTRPKAQKSKAKTRPATTPRARLEPVIEKIRERLLQNRAELLRMIESAQGIEREVGELTFSNEIDLASSLEGREMAFQLSSRDRHELKLIEDALVKMRTGTYGICESCGKNIGIKRLEILPLTTLCIDCQESMEHA